MTSHRALSLITTGQHLCSGSWMETPGVDLENWDMTHSRRET